ncbi:response regulator FixJ [Prosthecomicrobium pneumaticum]|uniref:Two-component system response regulator FixJ n=1 Tax=Prosthecomicrobium pneumaticum TaxID=81895 RepID=A0A7W9CTT7_9HYPH|nr:response regulator FixJ [Prosthecomicrobium pneumaticum]MBB5751292.1 two-component system response regulator FixJ [Prosthecomicrobium pneumaticum]
MKADSRVHVIDDDDASRESLVFLLGSAAIEAIGHASAETFLAALSEADPACVVTDVRMPGMSGIDLLRHLGEIGRPLPVIVMTGHGDVPMAVEALKAGALDFIEKPFEDEHMIGVVRGALEQATARRRQAEDKAAMLARLDTLTTRERQVFDGLVAGNPNKTIAYDLGISPRTVEIYRANVMAKLEAASLSDVIRIAFLAEEANRSI